MVVVIATGSLYHLPSTSPMSDSARCGLKWSPLYSRPEIADETLAAWHEAGLVCQRCMENKQRGERA